MTGRQLSFFPQSADEDGDQLDLIEEAGTEPPRPLTVCPLGLERGRCCSLPGACGD